MFRAFASAGLIAAAALGISAASPSEAQAGVLIQPAYYDGPAYGWRPPPAYGYWGVPRWRRHYDRPRFYGPPPPPPRYYHRWRDGW